MSTGAAPSSGSRPADQRASELKSLLAAASGGDESAFAQLYDQTSARVYGLVHRVLRDASQAAEVTQEAYLEVWQQASRFDGSKSGVLPWLLMIAHRRAVDRVRSAQATAARDVRYAELNSDRPYDSVTEQIETTLEAQQVRRELAGLTEVQREAVRLAYFEGYSYREVAELLNVPLGTVKSRIRDGLSRLRDAMGVSS